MGSERVRGRRCATTAGNNAKVREAACKVQDALQQSVAAKARRVPTDTRTGTQPLDGIGQQHWGTCGQTTASRTSGYARLRLVVPPQARRTFAADPRCPQAEPGARIRRAQRLLPAAHDRRPAAVATPHRRRHRGHAGQPRCLIQFTTEGTWCSSLRGRPQARGRFYHGARPATGALSPARSSRCTR
jgi:hypothetical protein